MSSTSNLSLIIGSLIVITFFQQNRGRINQQILISFKSCNYFYALCCLYIDNMPKILRYNNIASCKDGSAICWQSSKLFFFSIPKPINFPTSPH